MKTIPHSERSGKVKKELCRYFARATKAYRKFGDDPGMERYLHHRYERKKRRKKHYDKKGAEE